MNVLVTGAAGQLGRSLVSTAPGWASITAVSRQQMDITDQRAVDLFFAEHDIDWVINAAAQTNVDALEMDRDLAMQVNRDGAANVARACKQHEVSMLQVSTDYVFDGGKAGNYLPDDETCPINVYGTSKRDGELAVLEELPDALILRTSWLYAETGSNFVMKMLELMNQRSDLRVVDDQIGCPTSCGSLARCSWALIDKQASGIYHWCDAGVASKYDLAVAVYEISRALGLVNRDCVIEPVSSEEFKVDVKRPYCCVLDSSATASLTEATREHWRACLSDSLSGVVQTADYPAGES